MSPVTRRRLAVLVAGVMLALVAGPLKLLGDYVQFIVASAAFFFIAVLAVKAHSAFLGTDAANASAATLAQAMIEACRRFDSGTET